MTDLDADVRRLEAEADSELKAARFAATSAHQLEHVGRAVVLQLRAIRRLLKDVGA